MLGEDWAYYGRAFDAFVGVGLGVDSAGEKDVGGEGIKLDWVLFEAWSGR